MSGLLEALVERLDQLEDSLTKAHNDLCGCDHPGKADWCIAKPRDHYALLMEDPTQESFQMLEKLLAARP